MSLSCAFVGILPLVPDRFRQDIESIQSLIFGLTLFDGPDEVFWFPFAVGTMAGMAFSVIALLLYLPVFCFRVKEE